MAPTTDTWLLLASGPSAVNVDVSAYDDLHTVVVNDAWRLAPHALALYAADRPWWQHHQADVAQGFHGMRLASHAALGMTDLLTLRLNMHSRTLTRGEIYRGAGIGANSALQALQLMWTWGARDIHLGGLDLQAVDGQTHFFGDHPPEVDVKRRDFAAQHAELQHCIDQLLADGVTLTNLSPHSHFAGVPSA